ncbi:hypothetical protein Jiend_26270 [Micromonospora endophytica]|nr:LysM domain-containing protein [Micromonospora endophytica]RIW46816.1 LysM peptidoglycan-binding domain-containing protein [Micromonospora endophytica]BCJ59205.1 hypothetical protein Jiend_26270 [Micromonospora endophytica]
MAASGGTAVRRIGRVLTGFGALIVLVGLLAGGPIALLAFAGNPLPDHVPALAEIGTTLTSRDDGQLFLRALALVGWLGWVSFAFSVLVELGAQALRRPAPRLPGMSRQQRAAAALVGSVALILATSPAATAATTAYTAGAWAGAPTTAAAAGSPSAAAAGSAAMSTARAQALAAPAVGPAGMVAAGAAGPVTADRDDDRAEAPVYRVAKGDYLGKVAERYLDEFGDYRELAALNRLRDPDRIRPGQLITLPTEAADQGSRAHATGRLVARVAPPSSPSPAAPERTESRKPSPSPSGSPTPQPGSPTPQPGGSSSQPGGPAQEPGGSTQQPDGSTQEPGGRGSLTPVGPGPQGGEHAPPRGDAPGGHPPVVTVGAASASEPDRVNRPLAVSAVLAVASIIGAQIGAVLGMRRRPAAARVGGRRHVPVSPPSELPIGRHRRY